MFKRIAITFLLVTLALSSATAYTDIVGSGRTVRGAPGENDKHYGEPFTLAKEATLTSIVSENGGSGFIIVVYSNPRAETSYWTLSSTAAIGHKFGPGTFAIYPYLRQDSNDATISVRFTY